MQSFSRTWREFTESTSFARARSLLLLLKGKLSPDQLQTGNRVYLNTLANEKLSKISAALDLRTAGEIASEMILRASNDGVLDRKMLTDICALMNEQIRPHNRVRRLPLSANAQRIKDAMLPKKSVNKQSRRSIRKPPPNQTQKRDHELTPLRFDFEAILQRKPVVQAAADPPPATPPAHFVSPARVVAPKKKHRDALSKLKHLKKQVEALKRRVFPQQQTKKSRVTISNTDTDQNAGEAELTIERGANDGTGFFE